MESSFLSTNLLLRDLRLFRYILQKVRNVTFNGCFCTIFKTRAQFDCLHNRFGGYLCCSVSRGKNGNGDSCVLLLPDVQGMKEKQPCLVQCRHGFFGRRLSKSWKPKHSQAIEGKRPVIAKRRFSHVTHDQIIFPFCRRSWDDGGRTSSRWSVGEAFDGHKSRKSNAGKELLRAR